MKNLRKASSDPDIFALLDRNKCFSVVAAAVKEVVPDLIVDLKDPEVKTILSSVTSYKCFTSSVSFNVLNVASLLQLCVLVEVLPLSGVPDRTAIVGVSVLPRALVSTKPRLCIKALVSDTKDTNKKKR